MEQIRSSSGEVKLAGVDSEGVVFFDVPGQWKCRRCGGVFVCVDGSPVVCGCCNRNGGFDSVSPPVFKELWVSYGEPVVFSDLDLLYARIAGFIQDHVVLRDLNEVTVLALWIIASYKQDFFDTAPYLQFLGAIESGKSRSLDVLYMLAYRAVNSISVSPAALCRLIEQFHPTVLLDQAEQKFNLKSERGCETNDIFMSGNRKGQKYIVASRDDDCSIVARDVFGFKAIASTRVFDEALASRSIQFRMRQGFPKVKRISDDSWEEALKLRNMLLYYHLKDNSFSKIELSLTGRRYDLYYPLFTVGKEFGVVPDDVMDWFEEDKRKMDGEMSDTLEADILREIKIVLHGIDEQERIGVGDISQRLDIPSRVLGYRLKAMNIDRKHGRDGAFIDLTDDKTLTELQYLFSKYRVGV